MSGRDETSMGGPDRRFPATSWPQVAAAQTSDPQRRGQAIGAILAQYWKPVYAYLRRKGYANEPAKDITQGFFEDVVLRRQLLDQADQQKGRFRSLLLTALERYTVDVLRHEHRRKRSPAGGLVRLDGVDDSSEIDPPGGDNPEEAFTYAWASNLLGEVLAEVERQCRAEGLSQHWQVFDRMVARPALTGEAAPVLADLCRELGLAGPAKASNLIVTVKRRFRAVLLGRVRHMVGGEEDVEQEIADLMAVLARSG